MTPSDRNPLKEQVALLPLEPGVYQFLDRTGTVIYVGKAKSLRKRVSSYFMQNKEHPPWAGAGAPDRRDPPHRRRQRNRRPAARKFAHQGAATPLQHPAQRRQDLPVDRRAPRELPPHPVHAPVAARRLAILRALLVDDDAAQHPGIHPRGDSAAHLFAQSRSRSDRARPVHRLPAIPPGQLQRGRASARRAPRSTGSCSTWPSRCSKATCAPCAPTSKGRCAARPRRCSSRRRSVTNRGSLHWRTIRPVRSSSAPASSTSTSSRSSRTTMPPTATSCASATVSITAVSTVRLTPGVDTDRAQMLTLAIQHVVEQIAGGELARK